MNRDRFEGWWKRLNGALKVRWGMLRGDLSIVATGMRDQRAGRAQEKNGIARHESQGQLRDFLHRNRGWNSSSRQ